VDLKAAIERAIRFCPKGKTALATLQGVRFVPQANNCPALIYSTSGHMGTVVEVRDEVLPNALLPVAALRKALKDAKSVDAIRETKPGVFEVFVTAKKSKESMRYEIDGGDIATFPGYPEMPPPSEFEDVLDWDRILRVLAAVGTKDHEPDLKTVRFHADHVTATDLHWLLRVNRRTGWNGWILGDVFRTWPKGDVSVTWHGSYAFFRVGDETRFGALQPQARQQDSFGRFCNYVPPYHVVVDRILLQDVLTRAQDVSPWRMVAFDFGLTDLTVRAFSRSREAEAEASFEMVIPYLKSNIVDIEVLFDSTVLLSVCKLSDTPALRFWIVAANEPVQIESAELQAVVNPKEWDDRA
jgi:hypothetical protein